MTFRSGPTLRPEPYPRSFWVRLADTSSMLGMILLVGGFVFAPDPMVNGWLLPLLLGVPAWLLASIGQERVHHYRRQRDRYRVALVRMVREYDAFDELDAAPLGWLPAEVLTEARKEAADV